MFLKHFANKHQLPGLSLSGTLVENGLISQEQNMIFGRNKKPSFISYQPSYSVSKNFPVWVTCRILFSMSHDVCKA